MTVKNTHNLILCIVLIFATSTFSFGQKIRLDTVFYDREGAIVNQESDYLTYEVRQFDRKKRTDGSVARYTKSGRIIESTAYVKGEKKGTYYRFNPAGEVILSGNYDKGIKTGVWLTKDDEGYVTSIEKFDDSGTVIDKYAGPYAVVERDGPESKAKFVGGYDGWNLHLRQNLKYPLEAKRAGYQGNVYLVFTVLADGRISDLKVVDSPHEVLTEEALRMIKISPNWVPAKVDDKAVKSQMLVRIVFRLK